MARYTYIPNRVIDTDGISDGANLYFYQAGGTTPITVYSDADYQTPVANPYVVAAGAAVPALYWSYAGPVRVRVVDDAGAVISDDDPWPGTTAVSFSARTDISALTAYDDDTAYLTETGREGIFVFDSSDLSTEVAADPQEGVYIAPDSDPTGASGAWVRINDNQYNVRWFGAIGNDVNDDTAAIQAAIDLVSALRGGVVFFPIPSVAWRIQSTITVPIYVELHGAIRGGDGGCEFRIRSGTYTANCGILVNTTDLTDWATANPNLRTPTIRNIDFSTDVNTLYAIGFNGSLVVERCRFQFFASSVRGGTQYNDQVRISDCTMAASIQPATYQIDLGNTGDGIVIQQVNFPNVGNDPSTPLKSIKISGNNGFAIRDCLMGDVFIDNCTASSSIINSGSDGGRWLISNSNVGIRDCTLASLESEAAIVMDRDTTFGYQVSLSNVTITHDMERGSYQPNEFDIAIDTGYVVNFENVHKRIIVGTSTTSRRLQGVKVSNIAGTAISAFNDYSYIYSTNSTMRNQSMAGNPFSLEVPGTTISLLGSIGAFASATWEGVSDTYYYKAVMYYDTGRGVARIDGAAEVSLAVTNNGDAAGLDITEASYPSCKMVRIYRGTSTGSYDNYADIPIVSAPSLIDVGPHISGVPWISRSAGAVDTFNNYSLTGFGIQDGLAVFVASGAPTSGTWSRGDLTRHKSPAAAGNIGWVCVTAGTPGTWATYGGIATGQTYAPTNVTTDRAFDADTVAVAELADVVGTLIADLQGTGIID